MADQETLTVVICSTATEVGKTHVACELAAVARSSGLTVTARKPAQSFAADDGATDAERLAAATGEDPTDVCPPHRWYPVPLAPPMAAEVLDLSPFTLDDLVDELTWPPDRRLRLVETAGGVRSPIAADGDTADLCERLQPDAVVLVADAALGAINAVRLCLDALAGHRVVVYLNRFDGADETQARNLAWLSERDHFTVTTTPAALLTRLRS